MEDRKAVEIIKAIEFYFNNPEIWNSNFIQYQFEDMAKGGNPENVREDYYPTWTNEDFAFVIKCLHKITNNSN